MIDIIKIMVFPFVLIYSLVVKTRNKLFDKGVYKTEKVDAKVISIGNITVGGSGKTPTVVYVTKLLKKNNVKVGILSRGYRRKSKGYLLVSDGKEIKTSVDKAGDEIYLEAIECGTPAAVAERRVEGARKFLSDVQLEAIVLDDAFQHRWIHRDLDILLFDQRFLLKLGKLEQKLLPSGEMRESFDAIKRADIVIINRKFEEKKAIPEKLKKHFGNVPLFFASYKPTGFFDVKDNAFFPMEEFHGQKSLVVSGIARPFSFLHILENNNIDISNKLLFPDHKYYKETEVEKIRKAFYETNSHSVITTQKDAVKLSKYSKQLDDIDIYYLKIEIVFEDENNFEKHIMNIFNNTKGGNTNG